MSDYMLQAAARQRWPDLTQTLMSAGPDRPCTVAQRLASRAEARSRLGTTVHNYVSLAWLKNLAFFCWRAQSYATCTQREARREGSESVALREHLAKFLAAVGAFPIHPPYKWMNIWL